MYTNLVNAYSLVFAGLVKIAIGEEPHALQRLLQGRGGANNPRAVYSAMEDLVSRLNARPETLFFTGPDGKTYASSQSAVRNLPNQIALRVPGSEGYHILENRSSILTFHITFHGIEIQCGFTR